MSSVFIAVMGPSGAGKDTLMRGAIEARPDIVLARRAITRPADDATEQFESMTPSEFDARKTAGGFALHWRAHGLSYGLPVTLDTELAAGRHVLANCSRRIVEAIRARYARRRILVVGAPSDVLAARLATRGRETADEIEERLERALYAAPEGADVWVIDNSGDVDRALVKFLAALPAPATEPRE